MRKGWKMHIFPSIDLKSTKLQKKADIFQDGGGGKNMNFNLIYTPGEDKSIF